MKAQDIMTRVVQTAAPDMTVVQAAMLMADRHISGLPVVARNGEILGIVSESDLLHREELGTDEQRTGWSAWFLKPEEMAEKFAKAHGKKVHDVMSRPVVSVEAETELADVAETLDRHHVKRAPVLRDGLLVGIIARSDIVRALSRARTSSPKPEQPGETLREAIGREMKALPWLDTSYLNMTVLDGVVRLRGYVQSEEHRHALRVLLEGLHGVVAVNDDNVTIGLPTLTWDGRFD